jgi:hypothetical protein
LPYRRRGTWLWRWPTRRSVRIHHGATRPVSRCCRNFANKACYQPAAHRPGSWTAPRSAACSRPASQKRRLKLKRRDNAWPPTVRPGCPSWVGSIRRRFDCSSHCWARLSPARRIPTSRWNG